MRPDSIDERAALLADAYLYRQGIPQIEDEMLARNVPVIPTALQLFIRDHAFTAVVNHVAGQPVNDCPWDQHDPHRFRAALAAYWWLCHDTFLHQYRDNLPTMVPAPQPIPPATPERPAGPVWLTGASDT